MGKKYILNTLNPKIKEQLSEFNLDIISVLNITKNNNLTFLILKRWNFAVGPCLSSLRAMSIVLDIISNKIKLKNYQNLTLLTERL